MVVQNCWLDISHWTAEVRILDRPLSVTLDSDADPLPGHWLQPARIEQVGEGHRSEANVDQRVGIIDLHHAPVDCGTPPTTALNAGDCAGPAGKVREFPSIPKATGPAEGRCVTRGGGDSHRLTGGRAGVKEAAGGPVAGVVPGVRGAVGAALPVLWGGGSGRRGAFPKSGRRSLAVVLGQEELPVTRRPAARIAVETLEGRVVPTTAPSGGFPEIAARQSAFQAFVVNARANAAAYALSPGAADSVRAGLGLVAEQSAADAAALQEGREALLGLANGELGQAQLAHDLALAQVHQDTAARVADLQGQIPGLVDPAAIVQVQGLEQRAAGDELRQAGGLRDWLGLAQRQILARYSGALGYVQAAAGNAGANASLAGGLKATLDALAEAVRALPPDLQQNANWAQALHALDPVWLRTALANPATLATPAFVDALRAKAVALGLDPEAPISLYQPSGPAAA